MFTYGGSNAWRLAGRLLAGDPLSRRTLGIASLVGGTSVVCRLWVGYKAFQYFGIDLRRPRRTTTTDQASDGQTDARPVSSGPPTSSGMSARSGVVRYESPTASKFQNAGSEHRAEPCSLREEVAEP